MSEDCAANAMVRGGLTNGYLVVNDGRKSPNTSPPRERKLYEGNTKTPVMISDKLCSPDKRVSSPERPRPNEFLKGHAGEDQLRPMRIFVFEPEGGRACARHISARVFRRGAIIQHELRGGDAHGYVWDTDDRQRMFPQHVFLLEDDAGVIHWAVQFKQALVEVPPRYYRPILKQVDSRLAGGRDAVLEKFLDAPGSQGDASNKGTSPASLGLKSERTSVATARSPAASPGRFRPK